MAVQFTGVTAEQIPAVWPYVEKLIADALARGEPCFTAEDARGFLERGGWQLWVAHDGKSVRLACCTEILNFPKRKVCALPIVTGQDREDWIGNLQIIETWAAAQGCTLMKVTARPGWRRILKDYRWTHVELEKKLCPPQSPPTS